MTSSSEHLAGHDPPPSPLTAFVGRAEDLATLERWRGEGQRLISIVGTPGIGKTRLAIQDATRIDAERRLFCDVFGARDGEDVCARMARALGLSIGPDTDVMRAVSLALRARGDLLLILDNVDQLAPQARPIVQSWLGLASMLRVLVTSRERLGVVGEVVHELAPLSLPLAGSPMASEAVQLFVAHAHRLRRDFVLSPPMESTIAEIVRRLDGIPLAIELAVGWLDVLGPAQLLDRLPELARVPHARSVTLRHAIDGSWRTLVPWAQLALAQLSVFRGGFTPDAADAVLDLRRHDAPSVIEVLAHLRDKSLLFAYPQSEGVLRLGMFESIRGYAEEALATIDDGSAEDRHAEYFIREGALTTPQALGAERKNVTRVLEAALAIEPATEQSARRAAGALLTLDPLLASTGPFSRHLSWLDNVLAFPPELVRPRQLAQILIARGWALLARGRVLEGLAPFETAALLSVQLGDQALHCRATLGVGVSHCRSHRYVEATAALEQVLAATVESDVWQAGLALNYLGLVEHEHGRLESARTYYARLLAVLARDDHTTRVERARLEGWARVRLAFLHLEAEEQDLSELQADQGLAVSRVVKDRRLEGAAQHCRSLLAWEQGRFDEAAELAACGAEILEELGDLQNQFVALATRGAILGQLGEIDAADATLARGQLGLQQLTQQRHLWLVDLYRGHVELARSRVAAADVAATLRDRVSRRIAAMTTSDSGSSAVESAFEIRLAVRMLQRALEGSTPPDRALIVERSGKWFRLPDDVKPTAFGRREPLRRMFLKLADERRRTPGRPVSIRELQDAAWPGEIILPDAGANRVRVALNTLRGLGLRSVLLTRTSGYLIDAAVPLRLADGDSDQSSPDQDPSVDNTSRRPN